MNKLILLFLLFPLISFSQKKHDNTIVINHYINPIKIKSLLFTQGYSFTNNDTSFISTNEKMVNVFVSLKLNILVTDSAVYIKGVSKTTNPDQVLPTEFSKIFGIIGKDWLEMQRIASLLSDKVSYIKQ